MAQVKIRVQQADGKFKGTLFKDGPGYTHRWTGAPKPNLQEQMVCMGTIASGEWLLIEYVLPRQIVGDEESDSLFDELSHGCRRHPVQAMHWFMQQAFGPPPELVERVRRFAAGWRTFCASLSARRLLQALIDRKSIDRDDPLFAGTVREEMELLHRLDIAHCASGRKDSYFADSLAEEMGVDGYVAWINDHLDRVATAIRLSGPIPAVESEKDAAVNVQGSAQHTPHPSQALTDPRWAEMEASRRELKRQRVSDAGGDVQELFSLWQETTDLLFRPNVGDDARVEELLFLRSITFRLAAEAHKQNGARKSVQRLNSILRTLMPRDWFNDPALRSLVFNAVHNANVEIEELYFGCVQRPEPTDQVATGDVTLLREPGRSIGTGIQPSRQSQRPRRVQKNIDEAGHEHLCAAWDGQDPNHRRRPTWRELAQAVHKALGLATAVSSTLTALKSRAPRTKEKWEQIGMEMAAERARRVALRKK